MTLKKLAFSLSLLLCLHTASGIAQTLTPANNTLLFDANGKNMGPIVFGSMRAAGALHFRLTDGRSVLVALNKRPVGTPQDIVDFNWVQSDLFFAGDCTAAAYAVDDSAAAVRGTVGSLVAFGNVLYLQSGPPGVVTLTSRMDSMNGFCFPYSSTAMVTPVAAYVGLDTIYAQPFSLAGGPAPVLSPTFADVPPAAQFYESIELMRSAGITSGCGTDANNNLIYCPNDHVTRRQMAAFLARVLGLKWTP